MTRGKIKMRPKIGQKQWDFEQDSRTKSAISRAIMLSELAIEIQKDLNLRFGKLHQGIQ